MVCYGIFWSGQLLYAKNNIGPRMLPCGTAMGIFGAGDVGLSHIVR